MLLTVRTIGIVQACTRLYEIHCRRISVNVFKILEWNTSILSECRETQNLMIFQSKRWQQYHTISNILSHMSHRNVYIQSFFQSDQLQMQYKEWGINTQSFHLKDELLHWLHLIIP